MVRREDCRIANGWILALYFALLILNGPRRIGFGVAEGSEMRYRFCSG
jgi:hypothetical protein